MSEKIKLTKRSFAEQIDYFLAKGLSENGAITRACLTSMAMVAQSEVTALESHNAQLVTRNKALAEGLEKAAQGLMLIIPLAKGYTAQNNVGSNQDYVSAAIEAEQQAIALLSESNDPSESKRGEKGVA